VSSNDTAVKTITVLKDTDNDTVADISDNCVNDANIGQTDTDLDGIGDACDSTPTHDVAASNLNRGPSGQSVLTFVPAIFQVTADVVNSSTHAEDVSFALNLNQLALPSGCTASAVQTSQGGVSTQTVGASSTLNVTYDVTINCSGATAGAVGSLGISFDVTHVDLGDGVEVNLGDNSASDSVSVTVF